MRLAPIRPALAGRLQEGSQERARAQRAMRTLLPIFLLVLVGCGPSVSDCNLSVWAHRNDPDVHNQWVRLCESNLAYAVRTLKKAKADGRHPDTIDAFTKSVASSLAGRMEQIRLRKTCPYHKK